jgi:hypothetical protein
MNLDDCTTGNECAQCGAKSPPDGFTTKEVIHRKYNPQTRKQYVGKTKFTVCKGTACGAHLQMGHEG